MFSFFRKKILTLNIEEVGRVDEIFVQKCQHTEGDYLYKFRSKYTVLAHQKLLLTINLKFKSQMFPFFRIKILTLNIEEVVMTTTSITPFLLLKPFLLAGLPLSMSLDLSQLHKNGGKIFKLAVRLPDERSFLVKLLKSPTRL